jgi:hypothetical protein
MPAPDLFGVSTDFLALKLNLPTADETQHAILPQHANIPLE